MQVAPEFQRDPAALSMLYVRAAGGRLIPLDTLRECRPTWPLSSHTGQLPSVTIAFNLKEGVALGDAVNAIQATAAATLPSTVTTSFQGAAQAFQDSLRGLGLILLMAIVVIYIVLGVLYESFTHPLTFSRDCRRRVRRAPDAAGVQGGAEPYAFVGIIMLIGLVKKNGIMMVDFAVAAQRERGLAARRDS